MQHRQNISVVIPNYNGTTLLQKHLPAVLAALQDGDQVVIVDDASTDDSIEWLQKTYGFLLDSSAKPVHSLAAERTGLQSSQDYLVYTAESLLEKNTRITFTLVALQTNKRFGKAVNIGILFAQFPYFFLLNTDVEPQQDSIEMGLRHFSDTTVFGVGCLEYVDKDLADGSGKNILWFEKGLFRHSKAQDMHSGETAWVSGGSGLFSTAKWLKLQGFDPDFSPAYWEDIDISFRAKKDGYKVLFDEEMIVLHQHESTNSTALGTQNMLWISFQNAQIFTKKHGTFWQKLLYYLYKPYNLHAFNRFVTKK